MVTIAAHETASRATDAHSCQASVIGAHEITIRNAQAFSLIASRDVRLVQGEGRLAHGRLLYRYDPQNDLAIGDGEPIGDIAAVCLGVASCDEDDLYAAMDWDLSFRSFMFCAGAR